MHFTFSDANSRRLATFSKLGHKNMGKVYTETTPVTVKGEHTYTQVTVAYTKWPTLIKIYNWFKSWFNHSNYQYDRPSITNLFKATQLSETATTKINTAFKKFKTNKIKRLVRTNPTFKLAATTLKAKVEAPALPEDKVFISLGLDSFTQCLNDSVQTTSDTLKVDLPRRDHHAILTADGRKKNLVLEPHLDINTVNDKLKTILGNSINQKWLPTLHSSLSQSVGNALMGTHAGLIQIKLVEQKCIGTTVDLKGISGSFFLNDIKLPASSDPYKGDQSVSIKINKDPVTGEVTSINIETAKLYELQFRESTANKPAIVGTNMGFLKVNKLTVTYQAGTFKCNLTQDTKYFLQDIAAECSTHYQHTTYDGRTPD